MAESMTSDGPSGRKYYSVGRIYVYSNKNSNETGQKETRESQIQLLIADLRRKIVSINLLRTAHVFAEMVERHY